MRRKGPSRGEPSVKEGVSRRDFIFQAGAIAGGFMFGATGAAPSEAKPAIPATGLQPAPGPIPYSRQNPFRIAIIGCGGRMNGALLPAILKEENVEIVACVDPIENHLRNTLDRIEKVKGRRPQGLREEKDSTGILKREDIQGAVSACPCDLHAAIYLEALNNNKPIYGENPACLTFEESKLLREAWAKSKSIIQIGYQRRVSPRYAEGIELIRSGELGEPWEARAAWNNNGGPLGGPNDPDREWLSQRARSGDWMLEQASHTWDVLGWVNGESLPLRASGAGRRDVYTTAQTGRDVTDYYVATLVYPNGLLVNFNHTWFAPRKDNGAFSGVYERVCGLKGGIDLSSGRVSYADGRDPKLIRPEEQEMSMTSIRHFFECVREGKHPKSSLGNGINAVLTGLLVRKAVDERRWVTMDEIVAG